jgi:hypothetical protein
VIRLHPVSEVRDEQRMLALAGSSELGRPGALWYGSRADARVRSGARVMDAMSIVPNAELDGCGCGEYATYFFELHDRWPRCGAGFGDYGTSFGTISGVNGTYGWPWMHSNDMEVLE